MTRVTVDYDGEQIAPEPASAVIARFLRRSFSIADIARRAIRGWLFGLIGLVLGLVFGVYMIWATPPTYTVTIGLLPVDSSGDVSIGSEGSSALSALAGLVGMSGGPVPKFTRFVSSLYATNVATIMDKKYDMVCRSFNCDVKTHKWRKHDDFGTRVQRVVANIAHLPDPDAPQTARDLAEYTKRKVDITSDRTTHILTLSMDSRDPKAAVHFLTTLVHATNDFIRQEDRAVIQPYVDYINSKLATNNLNVAQRDALSSLLLDQERRLMLTSVDVPYAASIQDGPNIATSNNASRMLVADAFVGLVVGFCIGVWWNLRAGRNQARNRSWQQPY
jgi:hypothetical protein